MKDWKSVSHVRWDCKYHLGFVSKYRHRSIYGRIRKKVGAVSFAIPADSEGVKIISRIVAPRPRIELKAPYNRYGVADSVVVPPL